MSWKLPRVVNPTVSGINDTAMTYPAAGGILYAAVTFYFFTTGALRSPPDGGPRGRGPEFCNGLLTTRVAGRAGATPYVMELLVNQKLHDITATWPAARRAT